MNIMTGGAFHRAGTPEQAALGENRQVDSKGHRGCFSLNFRNGADIDRMRIPADPLDFAVGGIAVTGETGLGSGIARRHFSGPKLEPGGFVRDMARAAGPCLGHPLSEQIDLIGHGHPHIVYRTGDGPFPVTNHTQRRLPVVHDRYVATFGAVDNVACLTNHHVFFPGFDTAFGKQRFRNL